MQNNLKLAVGIIVALGLLLGLSIAQHARQYRQIQALEQRLGQPTVKIRPHCRSHEPKIIWIESENHEIKRAEWERQRAELEAIKAKMRAEREAQLQELHLQIEKVREVWKQGE